MEKCPYQDCPYHITGYDELPDCKNFFDINDCGTLGDYKAGQASVLQELLEKAELCFNVKGVSVVAIKEMARYGG